MNTTTMNPETNEPKAEINEHDIIKLRFALHLEGLPAGTTGTVVHVHPAKEAFEVKFPSGKVLTLEPAQVQLAQTPVPEPPITGVEFVPAPIAPTPIVRKPKKRRETKADRLQNAAQAVLDAVEEARAKADGLQAAIDEAKDELQGAIDDLQSAMEELKEVRENEYQSWYDNMPEGLQQNSPTGEKLSALLEIDLEPSMPEVPEVEEINFDDVESAAQQIIEADLPMGFGRD